jgi:hypothetical protein
MQHNTLGKISNMRQKVRFSLCLIKHHAMKIWGIGGIAPPFLISALNGTEWSASHDSHFTPWGTAPHIGLNRRPDGP